MCSIKRLLSLFLAGAILLLSAGCGADDPLTVTLRVSSTLGGKDEYNVYSGLLTDFSVQHPEIYLRDTTVPAADAFRLGLDEAAAYKVQDAPHVVYLTGTGSVDAVSSYLVSIDEIRREYPDYASGIPQSVLNCLSAESGLYCVPAFGEWSAIIVNCGILQKYSLDLPYDWNSLTHTVQTLSSAGVIPFANSPDESSAYLEALIASYGGDRAVTLGLEGYSNIITPYWRSALEDFAQLCRMGAFAPAALTDAIREGIERISAESSPVSPSDVSSSDADAALNFLPESYDEILGADRDRSLSTDAFQLFNSGSAAMIIADNASLSKINFDENCTAVSFFTPSGLSFNVGGFRSGFAITRRAFDDPYLRDAAVAFVEFMTSSSACAKYASLGYLPANESSVSSGAVSSVCSADGMLLSSTRSGSGLSQWGRIERLCSQLYYTVLSPDDVCAALTDLEKVWTPVSDDEPSAQGDDSEQPENSSASGSDID